jgi:hypothetical protein
MAEGLDIPWGTALYVTWNGVPSKAQDMLVNGESCNATLRRLCGHNGSLNLLRLTISKIEGSHLG